MGDQRLTVRAWRMAEFRATYPTAVSLSVTPCACGQTRQIERAWGNAGIPKRHLRCTFETFDALPEDVKTGKEIARNAAEMFAEYIPVNADGTMYYGLVLMGNTGLGKSGLMSAIAQCHLAAGTPLLWVDFNEFIEAVRKTYEEDSEISTSTIVETAQRAPLLCLDDLGDVNAKGPVTDHTREKTYAVIRYRYENELPTLITTNLDFQQMKAQFGPRIADRVFEMCCSVLLSGKSLRFGR